MSIEAMKQMIAIVESVSWLGPHAELAKAVSIGKRAIAEAEKQEPVTVTAEMVRAFHHAISDDPLNQADEFEIQTGLEAAFAHITNTLQRKQEPVEFDVRCDNCGGNGYDPENNNYFCEVCNGGGFIQKLLYTSQPQRQKD